jgi:hypothetical protein
VGNERAIVVWELYISCLDYDIPATVFSAFVLNSDVVFCLSSFLVVILP